MCPSGGWRSHCPYKGKCLYRHKYDKDHDIQKADKNARINIGNTRNSYKSRLRYKTNRTDITTVTTPTKGGGLLGIARSIRRTPSKVPFSDDDDLISTPIDVPVLSEVNDSSDESLTNDVHLQKADSGNQKQTGRYTSFSSQNLHNLRGT